MEAALSAFFLSWYFPFLLLAMTPWASSAVALIIGLVLSLGLRLPLPALYKKFGKFLLQFSIVVLGFAMDPSAVWRAGLSGVAVTFASLALTLVVGYFLARQFKILGKVSALIAVGTAICGGSAIAAIGPVLHAEHEDMSISLAVVFLLNALALLIFPQIGLLLQMTPQDFGVFAAIAIHDTSSVVGAATRFADAAVPVAITIKLTRALWIIPLTLFTAYWMRRRAAQVKQDSVTSPAFPWFILLFVGAVIFKAFFSDFEKFYLGCEQAGKAGLKGAIFIISSQMTWSALKKVGYRPLAMAVVLWLLVIFATLAALRL